MPETGAAPQHFLVVAYSHDNFRVWARQYGVARTYCTYVTDESSTLGYHDYTLIVLSGSRLDREFLDRLYADAKEVYDEKQYYPVTQAGRIIRWERFKKP